MGFRQESVEEHSYFSGFHSLVSIILNHELYNIGQLPWVDFPYHSHSFLDYDIKDIESPLLVTVVRGNECSSRKYDHSQSKHIGFVVKLIRDLL